MEEVDPEVLEAFNKNVEAALAFVQEIYEMELANRTMAEADADISGKLSQNLEKFDVFAQLTYVGNLQQGDLDKAIKGIQTSIRSAFVYGYILAKVKYQKHDFTPLLQPLKGSIQ